MKAKNLKGTLMLFAAALIWGLAFVVQSSGMEYIGPFTFTFSRSVVGAAALLPMTLISREKSESPKTLWTGGILCGAALGAASCLQQLGLLYTTAGKAGFITALYIIMIPVVSVLFLKKKYPKIIYAAVAMAVLGVYLLCINGEFLINKGDIYEFLCAVMFTAQILLVSHFSKRINAYKLSCIEFAVAAVVSAVPMLIAEKPTLHGIAMSWLPLLYMGVLSSAVGYTLQVIGQRNLNPTVAALIMSLESCVSVIGGWLILGQSLTPREIIGCVVMFAAIIVAQLPAPKRA